MLKLLIKSIAWVCSEKMFMCRTLGIGIGKITFTKINKIPKFMLLA